jgi:hypothetical protein
MLMGPPYPAESGNGAIPSRDGGFGGNSPAKSEPFDFKRTGWRLANRTRLCSTADG